MKSLVVLANAATDAFKEQTGKMTGGKESLEASIAKTLGAVFLALGVVAVIVIIIGGINMTVSQGDPGKVKKARDTILYAIVGLVASLCAFAITQFVLSNLK